MQLSKAGFGSDFKWGVSAAAYQIEGAHNAEGKGASIWDVFSQTRNKIYKNQHANIACDFYNRYQGDLLLMRSMNIKNYRFSLSWSRIFPHGIGSVNYKGVHFYNNLINFCLEQGIEPWITLYHWDLPHELEKKGGFTNRDIINWFSEYVSFCISTFGDRVKHWMILNEPMVFTGAGYFMGVHAPGKKGLTNFLKAFHHAALCQAEGGRVARAISSNIQVGTTISCSYIEPYRNTEADIKAAARVDALINRSFIEPLIGLGYPVKDSTVLQRLEPYIKDGDESRLAFDMDFIGIQNYTREVVKFSYLTPFINAAIIKADKRNVERTQMNWEVHPECIYQMLKKYSLYDDKIKQILITENGAAFKDEINGEQIIDTRRKKYLQDHIAQVLRAKNEGIKVNGYFVWSFTDNFEWAEGYYPRFGLVYIDYETQKRFIKSSGRWYSNFLKEVEPVTATYNTISQTL